MAIDNGCDGEVIDTATNFQTREIAMSGNKNNSSFSLKQPAVADGSDGSDRTLYPLTENETLPVAPVTGRCAYLPTLLCTWFTHPRNDTCVTLFPGAAVMQ
jgi:hypothetical protein